MWNELQNLQAVGTRKEERIEPGLGGVSLPLLSPMFPNTHLPPPHSNCPTGCKAPSAQGGALHPLELGWQ